MARGWPAYGLIACGKYGLFVQKLAVHDERLLFPKAVIRTGRTELISMSAFGQKRTYLCRGRETAVEAFKITAKS